MEVRTVLRTLALMAALGAAPVAFADDCAGQAGGKAVKLVVEMDGVRAATGNLNVTVYPDDSRRFLAHGGKLLRLRAPAMKPLTTACFWLPPGVYALAIYHDADGDRKFDRTLAGMPAEGYAFSNNAPARFGLPSFDSVRFRLNPATPPMRVHMRYPR